MSDMKSPARKPYHSPVREERARQTRERILESVAEWMKSKPGVNLTLEALAPGAGIEKRTILRHFESKEALLEAFWVWVNDRISPNPLPKTVRDLVEGPRRTYPKFDGQEALIRASLHSSAGRAMRGSTISARREAFKIALEPVTAGLPSQKARHLEALAHLLFSAAAWETLRDYAGLSGEEAGEATSWALGVLISSGGDQPHPSEGKSP